MDAPYVNMHTHRRTGEGIEVVSVMAGRGAREAARQAMVSGAAGAADLTGTASVEVGLPEPPFSLGIHPWQLSEMDETFLAEALREVETAPVFAIGEIGLDYAIPADHSMQKMVFAAQLRIAQARRLPVVLHCVRAFEPTMEILSAHPNLPAVIFHGFIGSSEQATRAVKAGCFLSFGQRGFASPKTIEALRSTPPERIFLETDDSPSSIARVYALAGETLNIPRETLLGTIYENYEQLAGKN